MIKDKTPLSMAESLEYLKGDGERETEVKKFIENFVNIDPKKAKKIREKIEGLDLLKIKPEHVAKIVDLMPENDESLNKIFNDISLDEDEKNKILQSLEEFR